MSNIQFINPPIFNHPLKRCDFCIDCQDKFGFLECARYGNSACSYDFSCNAFTPRPIVIEINR